MLNLEEIILKLAKSVLTVTLGLGLVGLAQPVQAAKRSHTVPTTFRHTWYAYDHGTYDRLTLTKHSLKGIMRYEGGARQIWASAKGNQLGVWSHGKNKLNIYKTTRGYHLASQPINLTHGSKAGHARLYVHSDGYQANYYRTKSVAYRYR